MEAQLAALTEQLRAMGERQALLEQELAQRPAAAGDPPGLGRDLPGRPTGVGVDTRRLGKPRGFSGRIDDCRDWSVVFEGYAAAAVPGCEAGMSRAVGAKAIALNATLESQPSQHLYWMPLMLCKNTALQIVVGARGGEGLEAWKLLVERYEPRLRTRYAAQLMKIMSFSLQGDLLERLGLWEREIQLYGSGSGKVLDAEFRIGTFMRQLLEGPMKIYLLMRVDVLRTWIDFRQEVLAITRAMISAQETPTPMDIGVVGKGNKGGKGGRGGQGKKCSKCGKMGHTQENCWAGGKGGGNGGKAGPKKCDNCGKQGHTASSCWQNQGGKGKGKSGNANSAQSQKTCWVCGKIGHLSKDCKNRVGAATEGGGTASSAAPLENASVDWAHFSEFLDVGTLEESSDSEDQGLTERPGRGLRGVAPHNQQRRSRVGGARGMGT